MDIASGACRAIPPQVLSDPDRDWPAGRLASGDLFLISSSLPLAKSFDLSQAAGCPCLSPDSAHQADAPSTFPLSFSVLSSLPYPCTRDVFCPLFQAIQPRPDPARRRWGRQRWSAASFRRTPSWITHIAPLIANLKHAREMISRAVAGDGGAHLKPDLVVLPVSQDSPVAQPLFSQSSDRNASILSTVTSTSQYTLRRLASHLERHMILLCPKARLSSCSQLLLRKRVSGFLEVRIAARHSLGTSFL